jgi:hypothetical protein
MTTTSPFYVPLTLHRDAASTSLVAPILDALPLLQSVSDQVVILEMPVGHSDQGLYLFDDVQGTWRFAMHMLDISKVIIDGDDLEIYVNATTDVTLSPSAIIYKNGILQESDIITHGHAVYAVRTPAAGGGGSGAVNDVNGKTGSVVVAGDGATTTVTNSGANIIISFTGADEGIYQ